MNWLSRPDGIQEYNNKLKFANLWFLLATDYKIPRKKRLRFIQGSYWTYYIDYRINNVQEHSNMEKLS